MDDDIVPLKNLIVKSFENITNEQIKNSNDIESLWKKVLEGIRSKNPNEGRNLITHSRIIDYKNGILLIEADHPGWISLLQLYKKFIINGLNMYSDKLRINTLAFKLKGKKGNLFDIYSNRANPKDAKKIIEKRINQEEVHLKEIEVNKKNLNKVTNVDLPEELKILFDDLQKNMLTNSKN